MKMTTIRIKNIYSHEDSSFWLENYNTFIGENNSGKSNIFFAVRWFFGEIKLTSSNTFNGAGGESSVCITFHVDDEEIDLLGINKDAVESGFVSIEAYYEFDPDEAKSVSPTYRYISSDDSVINCRPKPEFISPKNVVYIPAIKKLDDELKFTNKSAINKLVSKYFIDHIRNDENCSCKYREISTKVNELSELLKKEDSGPCESLKSYVNKYMLDYGDLNFSVTLVPPMLDEFIKNSFNISVLSNGSNLSLDSQGMGFQRSLLFSLLCIIADINGNSYPTIYLIEEPELYLHPNHQIHFRDILIKLSQKENNQILATSHSPYFVNHINKYSQIKVVSMNEKRSQINQISQDDVNAIVEEDANTRLCCELDYIYGRYSDEEIEHIKDIKKNDDHLRYLLWMDPLRANAFFSKKCILVEGSTEKAFFSFIFYHPEGALYSTDTSNVAIFDTVGKFNIIPFANLLKKLGIDVWVIFDDDEGKEANGISHNKINEYIEKLVSDNIAIKCLKLNSDIEKFLGVEKNSRKPDISLYQKLVDNKNECLHTEGYSKIVEFVESVLEYRY